MMAVTSCGRRPSRCADRLGDARRTAFEAGVDQHEVVAGLDQEDVDAVHADPVDAGCDQPRLHWAARLGPGGGGRELGHRRFGQRVCREAGQDVERRRDVVGPVQDRVDDLLGALQAGRPG